MLRLRISSQNLSNQPRAPTPIDPRAMRMDAQTYRDLEIYEAATGESVYDICNQTRTGGGAKLLRARMRKPWSKLEKIRDVQESLTFIIQHRDAFDRLPWDTATSGIERYLKRGLTLTTRSGRIALMMEAWSIRLADVRTYGRLMQGVLSTASMIRSLRAVLDALGPVAPTGELRVLVDEMRELLDRPDIAQMPREERWDLPGWKILELDAMLRTTGRQSLERLLHLVYEVDALAALADTVVQYGLVIPEIHEGPLEVKAEGVYHPFIEGAVANSVRLDQDKRMLFLTGPNMAGKTTYLKATGIAVYLAHLGMGVPARSFRFSPCDRLFTSITITDNVRTGVSFFRAEALRMKSVAQAVADGARVVALLDEPFKGTNLKDALDASREILERLAMREGSVYMVASHLIELGERMQATGHVDCRLFEASEEGEHLRFEYQLRPGISSQRLGMRVLTEEGIFELLDRPPVTGGRKAEP
jgi:DNA mismatch repair protein MutS